MAKEQAKTISEVLNERGISDLMGERIYGLHFRNSLNGKLDLTWTEKDAGYVHEWHHNIGVNEKVVGELIMAGVPKYQESAIY